MYVQAPSSSASWTTMTAIVAALASATPPYIQNSDRKYIPEILKIGWRLFLESKKIYSEKTFFNSQFKIQI